MSFQISAIREAFTEAIVKAGKNPEDFNIEGLSKKEMLEQMRRARDLTSDVAILHERVEQSQLDRFWNELVCNALVGPEKHSSNKESGRPESGG